MATVSAVNVTDSPVLIDGEGRVLAGGERGDVDSTDPAVEAAVQRGALLVSERVAARIAAAEDEVAPVTPAAVEAEPAPRRSTSSTSQKAR